MFFLTGGVAVIICAVIEYLFFCKSNKATGCIGILLKHCIIDYSVALTLLVKVLKYKHFINTAGYGIMNFIKFGILTLAVGLAIIAFTAIFKGYIEFENELMPRNKKGKVHKGVLSLGIIGTVFVFLACVCYFGTEWSLESFGKVTAEQFVFNLTAPGGAEKGVYISVFEGPFIYTTAITSLFAFLYYSTVRIIYNGRKKKQVILNGLAERIICLVLAVSLLAGGLYHGIKTFDLKQLYYAY